MHTQYFQITFIKITFHENKCETGINTSEHNASFMQLLETKTENIRKSKTTRKQKENHHLSDGFWLGSKPFHIHLEIQLTVRLEKQRRKKKKLCEEFSLVHSAACTFWRQIETIKQETTGLLNPSIRKLQLNHYTHQFCNKLSFQFISGVWSPSSCLLHL